MFSALLKIIPRLDNAALNNMEKNLSSRFEKVAKNFGSGLIKVLKGGAIGGTIAAIGLAIIDKVLSPLQEVQAAMDKTLENAKDFSVEAIQFDTTSGRLEKIVRLANSAGLDKESLFLMMSKFQAAVADARLHPNDPSNVKAFVNEKDTAAGFFSFMQGRSTLDPTRRAALDQEMFGERFMQRAREFVNLFGAELPRRMAALGLNKTSAEKGTSEINRMAGLADRDVINKVKGEREDFFNRGAKITDDTIDKRNTLERLQASKLTDQFDMFDVMMKVDTGMVELQKIGNEGLKLLGWVIEKVPSVIHLMEETRDYVKGIVNSKFFRFLVPGKKGR